MILRTSTDGRVLCDFVKAIVPKLTFEMRKGQCGRIGVIGGSQEYTGAPYFAAISAIKAGADLAHVFCPRDAAVVIKSYSPELIVHPTLETGTSFSETQKTLERMHALVLGPGLGRRDETVQMFGDIVQDCLKREIPFVIDADGLFFVSKNPKMLHSAHRGIITPNEHEFNLLYNSVIGRNPATTGDTVFGEMKELSKALGNVTIVRKGATDIITNGHSVFVCDAKASPRRCGGQGDLLSGSLGTFSHWASMAAARNESPNELKTNSTLVASYAACLLTRECNRIAFEKFGRSTTTSDMITYVHEAFENLYEHKSL